MIPACPHHRIAAETTLAGPLAAEQDVARLVGEGEVRLVASVHDESTADLEVHGQGREVGQQLVVAVPGLRAADLLRRRGTHGAGGPAQVLVLVIAHDRAGAGRIAEEAHDLERLRPAVDQVAYGDDGVISRRPDPIEQRQQLVMATVDVPDHDQHAWSLEHAAFQVGVARFRPVRSCGLNHSQPGRVSSILLLNARRHQRAASSAGRPGNGACFKEGMTHEHQAGLSDRDIVVLLIAIEAEAAPILRLFRRAQARGQLPGGLARAMALFEARDFSAAAAATESVIDHDGLLVAAHLLRGLALLGEGDVPGAMGEEGSLSLIGQVAMQQALRRCYMLPAELEATLRAAAPASPLPEPDPMLYTCSRVASPRQLLEQARGARGAGCPMEAIALADQALGRVDLEAADASTLALLASLVCEKAVSLVDLRRFEAARDLILVAVELAPRDPGVFAELGHVCDALGRHAEALDAYGQCRALDQTTEQRWTARALRGMASVRIGRGNLESARALLDQSLQLDPHNPAALSDLEYIRARRGGGR